MLQEVQHRPATGLQSYIDASPDYELYPVGIASIQDQAKKLAEYGRNGDIYIVHATEGETVIPMEVLNANPKVKSLLFTQMKDMGLEPSAYVVGNQLNSINPVTGVPEFFFSSIFRGIKKAVKSVLKFAKEAAPTILPIAASLFGFPAFMGPSFGAGTFGAAALSSGIGSLIETGGDLKKAFKSAALGGGLSLLAGGIRGGFDAPGKGFEAFGKGFTGGVEGAFTGYTPVYGAGATGAATPIGSIPARSLGQSWDALTTGGGIGDLITGRGGDYLPASETPSYFSAVDPSKLKSLPGGQTLFAPTPTAPAQLNVSPSTSQISMSGPLPKSYGIGSGGGVEAVTGGQPVTSSIKPLLQQPKVDNLGWSFEDIIERISPSDPSMAQTVEKAANINKALVKANLTPLSTKEALAQATKELTLSPLRKWGPLGAGAAALAYAGGAFDEPPEDVVGVKDSTRIVDQTRTGQTLLEQDPESYVVQNLTPYSDAYNRLLEERLGGTGGVAYAARGGGVNHFPRRTGQIRGPGTATSDDVPAMLSDGEFVMTKRAVDGAGGPNKMYNMMRNFEMKT
jgi:hypothetical protein